MLDGAKYIMELYNNDEFKPILIQGDHGYGKTSYANTLIAEVYSKDGKKANWSFKDRTDGAGNVKEYSIFPYHIGFHPLHVLKLWINKPGSIKYKDQVFHWDDAGLWLNALDYQDPFVKSAGKYMQVARSDWAAIIFTAISREDISSKIRGLRHAVVVDITKTGKDEGHPNRRSAQGYILRKGWKGREYKDVLFEEFFNCHVPGVCVQDHKGRVLQSEGFFGWYKPLRDKYAEMAKQKMKQKAKDHPDFKDDDLIDY